MINARRRMPASHLLRRRATPDRSRPLDPMRINFYPMQAIAVQPPWAGEDVWYPSVVLDYAEGKSLQIGAPLSRRQEVLIPPGTRVRLQLALPDGLRRFSAVVRDRLPTSPPSLELTWPEDFQRI